MEPRNETRRQRTRRLRQLRSLKFERLESRWAPAVLVGSLPLTEEPVAELQPVESAPMPVGCDAHPLPDFAEDGILDEQDCWAFLPDIPLPAPADDGISDEPIWLDLRQLPGDAAIMGVLDDQQAAFDDIDPRPRGQGTDPPHLPVDRNEAGVAPANLAAVTPGPATPFELERQRWTVLAALCYPLAPADADRHGAAEPRPGEAAPHDREPEFLDLAGPLGRIRTLDREQPRPVRVRADRQLAGATASQPLMLLTSSPADRLHRAGMFYRLHRPPAAVLPLTEEPPVAAEEPPLAADEPAGRADGSRAAADAVPAPRTAAVSALDDRNCAMGIGLIFAACRVFTRVASDQRRHDPPYIPFLGAAGNRSLPREPSVCPPPQERPLASSGCPR